LRGGGIEALPIRPFLTDQVFTPETIREMSLALEGVCSAIGLRMTDDPATRLVAAKIIELAQQGVRGDELRSMILKEFKNEE
jgi:hypothetical protein